MIAKLIQDFIHFKGSKDSFDENGGADGALGYTDVILGKHEYIVPETCLQVALHLRQIEIGSYSLTEQIAGVMEEEQSGIEQRPRYRLTINRRMLFDEMPSSRTNQ